MGHSDSDDRSGGFTMISGLLIIILERTQMIGVLKALGADNASIRQIFLSFSVFLIGRGMCWGNVIGLSCCLIQYFFEPIKLDPGYVLCQCSARGASFGLDCIVERVYLAGIGRYAGRSFLSDKPHSSCKIHSF